MKMMSQSSLAARVDTPVCVSIDLGDRSYPILIGAGLLQDGGWLSHVPVASSAVIVTNTTVGPLYEAMLRSILEKTFRNVLTVVLPDGEQYKNFDSMHLIYDALLENECDRKTVLFALGGGVVGDMTGFAAATYMRGIPFIQIPTTLLSQVDSSVGGKTGINHPKGKNMIGAFYQPHLVVCDIDTLKTLPAKELSAGLAEVIKYGPIADLGFMGWLESAMPDMRAQVPSALIHAIERSCQIKAHVVSQDERESGIRAILNFGHTFGHAVEAGMGYGQWLHGEAVAVGMVMAAELSHRLDLIDADFVQRLRRLIGSAGLPVRAPILSAEGNEDRYWELMRLDKKAEAGAIKFVVIDKSGSAHMQKAPEDVVRAVIAQCCA